MNAELLLQHFKRLSEAPDAIPHLRRFILNLAVRGKLLEQDLNDEPAAELLKRIQTEKTRLMKEKKIKKQVITLPVGKDDEPFPIPNNWAWTRLGQIADWGSGSTPSRGNHEFFGGDITWLKSGELNDNQQLTGSEETVTDLAIRKCSFRNNQPGDVLIAMYGATIGKVAILAEPAVTNQAVCGCTPFSGVFNRYLFNFLLSQREQFHSASEGGAQPNISKVKVVGFAFPLPPITEQHRIVAKVDELMTLCDQLEAAKTEREQSRDRLLAGNLQRLNHPADDEEVFHEHARFTFNHLSRITTRPEHIKQLRQTILNLAVRGKLVPQNPNDEPASELLKRIIKEKELVAKGEKTKKENLLFENRAFGKSFRIPESWHWTSFGEIAFEFRYGTSVKCSYTPIGEPVLRIPNIDNGRINIDNLKFGPLPTREAENLRLRLGDILIVRSNGSLDLVGRPALVDTHAIGYCYAGYLVRVRTSTIHLYAPYLLLSLNTSHARDQIEIPIRTTVGLKNVNATELGGLTIPLPPLNEQHRIVAKVDELMALCDQLETQLNTTENDSRHLLEAVLHEALSPALEEAA